MEETRHRKDREACWAGLVLRRYFNNEYTLRANAERIRFVGEAIAKRNRENIERGKYHGFTRRDLGFLRLTRLYDKLADILEQ